MVGFDQRAKNSTCKGQQAQGWQNYLGDDMSIHLASKHSLTRALRIC